MNLKLMDWISSQDPLLKLITSNLPGKNKAIIADHRINSISVKCLDKMAYNVLRIKEVAEGNLGEA